MRAVEAIDAERVGQGLHLVQGLPRSALFTPFILHEAARTMCEDHTRAVSGLPLGRQRVRRHLLGLVEVADLRNLDAGARDRPAGLARSLH